MRSAKTCKRKQKGGDLEVLQPFSKFIVLYEENKDKLLMPLSGNHPLNREAVEHWKERIQTYSNIPADTAVYQKFADLFARFMRYVSFEEYMAKISEISNEILGLITENLYDKIILVIDGDTNKSNLWVGLLITGELLKLELPEDSIQKMFVANSSDAVIKYAKENPEEKILGLHADDMSYSGRQISSSISREIDEQENLVYRLAVPYIGSFAVELIKEEKLQTKEFKLSRTEVIPSFSEQVTTFLSSPLNSSEKDLIRKVKTMCTPPWRQGLNNGAAAFNCHKGLVPIYFDHKIADSLSTFQKVLMFGSYPRNEDAPCIRESLIVGCEAPPLNATMNTCRTTITNLEDLGVSPCPPAFYKGITYTFHGNRICSNINPIIHISTLFGGRRRRSRPTRGKRTRRSRSRK